MTGHCMARGCIVGQCMKGQCNWHLNEVHIWRVHTEALLTYLRVIDNWPDVKKQILLIFYANLHHNSYVHKKGRCCLLDMIECQNSLNLACVEIAWKPNYFQLWIDRYVRTFDFTVVLTKFTAALHKIDIHWGILISQLHLTLTGIEMISLKSMCSFW